MSIITNHKNDIDDDIVNSLESLYSNNLIYRSIIVCDDDNIDIYKCRLEDKDYNVYVLTEYENIDYDIIDTRIFIIKEANFISFFKNYKKHKQSHEIHESHEIHDDRYFYNMIFFTSQKNKDILTSEYKNLITNDNIII